MLTRRATLAGLAVLGLPLPARAQAFPNRTITIIVPYTPAGPIDIMARLVAQEAAAELRQSVVVENRPGGSGIIGSNAVARAEPDGYTLVFGTSQTHVINQSMIKNCPYDAVKDFSPVAGITVTPHVLVVRKDLPAASLGEFIALAKAKPGTLTFGTIGPGSSGHLATELFKLKSGLDMLHVPFKGLAPLTTELLAGRIDLSIAPLPGLIQKQVESGSIRPLALASAKRTEFLPSLPTFAEGGVAGCRGRRLRRAVCAGPNAARGHRPAVSSDGRGGNQGASGGQRDASGHPGRAEDPGGDFRDLAGRGGEMGRGHQARQYPGRISAFARVDAFTCSARVRRHRAPLPSSSPTASDAGRSCASALLRWSRDSSPPRSPGPAR